MEAQVSEIFLCI